MIICESEFVFADPKNPDIALQEIDYYASAPARPGVPNHSLSLRKRFTTGNYEVYMAVQGQQSIRIPGAIGITNTPTGKEYTLFESPDLIEAIAYASSMTKKTQGYESKDKICTHIHPNRAHGCRIK